MRKTLWTVDHKAIRCSFDKKALVKSCEAACAACQGGCSSFQEFKKAACKTCSVQELADKRIPKQELEMQNKIKSLWNKLCDLNNTNLQLQ